MAAAVMRVATVVAAAHDVEVHVLFALCVPNNENLFVDGCSDAGFQ